MLAHPRRFRYLDLGVFGPPGPAAEPGARIAALYFNEQDLVANGHVLAKLDDIELSTQLRQMEGALNLAKALYEQHADIDGIWYASRLTGGSLLRAL